jgi:hypothetical protein
MGVVNIVRGDQWPLTFVLMDPATNLPVNLMGFESILTVTSAAEPVDNTTKIFNCIGIPASDQTVNTGVVTFTPTIFQTSVSGAFFYDIEISDGTLRKTFFAGNKFNITQDNTKGFLVEELLVDNKLHPLLSGVAAGTSTYVWVPEKRTVTVRASGLVGADAVEIHQPFFESSEVMKHEDVEMILSTSNTFWQVNGPVMFRVTKGITANCEVGYYGEI